MGRNKTTFVPRQLHECRAHFAVVENNKPSFLESLANSFLVCAVVRRPELQAQCRPLPAPAANVAGEQKQLRVLP